MSKHSVCFAIAAVGVDFAPQLASMLHFCRWLIQYTARKYATLIVLQHAKRFCFVSISISLAFAFDSPLRVWGDGYANCNNN